MGCGQVPREQARARPWAARTTGQTGRSWTADLLPEFILRARRKPEGAEVGSGRSQGWGLGGLGGKSRAGQDGQVLRAGVSWQRERDQWVGQATRPLPATGERAPPDPPFPSTPRVPIPASSSSYPQESCEPQWSPSPLDNPRVPGTTLAWWGSVSRCEGGLPGEASPQPTTLTYLRSSMHLSAKKDTRGPWSAPQAGATFPTGAACPLPTALESWSR